MLRIRQFGFLIVDVFNIVMLFLVLTNQILEKRRQSSRLTYNKRYLSHRVILYLEITILIIKIVPQSLCRKRRFYTKQIHLKRKVTIERFKAIRKIQR